MVDSTADLPADVYAKHDLTVVPLTVHFGEKVYLDHTDLKAEDFYAKLASTDVLPYTSPPTTGAFLRVYEELTAGGDEVVSIHLSGKLSQTVHHAALARDLLPRAAIEVIDTGSASLGTGLAAMAAVRAAATGKEAHVVAEAARAVAARLQVLFVVDSLNHLARNGRIGGARALLGKLLGAKPILTVTDGSVAPAATARGRDRALQRVTDLLIRRIPPRSRVHLAIAYSGDRWEAEALLKDLSAHYRVDGAIIGMLGPVIGVHTGPGSVGVCAYMT